MTATLAVTNLLQCKPGVDAAPMALIESGLVEQLKDDLKYKIHYDGQVHSYSDLLPAEDLDHRGMKKPRGVSAGVRMTRFACALRWRIRTVSRGMTHCRTIRTMRVTLKLATGDGRRTLNGAAESVSFDSRWDDRMIEIKLLMVAETDSQA